MKAIIAVPATLALIYRAHSHNSLTPAGIVAATLTAGAHAVHPWNLPFVLLCVFFLAGTRVTKIKKDVKASLTLSSQGSSGGEGPRTHVQVLANSLVASILTLLHAYQIDQRKKTILAGEIPQGTFCYSWGKGDLLVIGIIANYAAVAADTFSSELGILSKSSPRLITSWNLRKVPRGTNGGVTLWGLVAGLLGSLIMVTASLAFLPMCNGKTTGPLAGGNAWTTGEKTTFAWSLVIWGALGSVLDSLLGGWLQKSVRDVRTGKIVEGDGGLRVLTSTADNPNSREHFKKTADVKSTVLKGEGKDAVEKTDGTAGEIEDVPQDPYDPNDKHRASNFGDHKPTRIAESGYDILDNNDVNLLMASTMSIGAMAGAALYWGIPLNNIFRP
ncbi:putative Integral membrane protein DUF92-domain-containing protein [Seiridium unicorne]|uniref:Integral membrane protein DUF92-domain-containing protein n=1 Tax=Seiridium unicorne TaxID=138068 RepID=A0ABR2UTH2_9PEZI